MSRITLLWQALPQDRSVGFVNVERDWMKVFMNVKSVEGSIYKMREV